MISHKLSYREVFNGFMCLGTCAELNQLLLIHEYMSGSQYLKVVLPCNQKVNFGSSSLKNYLLSGHCGLGTIWEKRSEQ